ncbi:7961_t:CDS:10 [Dentiscutata erythropus]|uniref:7961_t:CDS:1 n=1 Tax=Dentiscutata erythropus TaxID=1348616 RepID=A0A9N9I958_9GLOM|nr:7961_t:CDS:10 [Dentiscutata erythropus]
MAKPRVAIIGAGSSGLASLKQCLADDLDPICFEQTSYVGGLWNFVEIDDDENKDPHSSIYKSLITNVSKEMMTFSDFPIPAEWPSYLHNSLLAKPYIKFRTTVVRVSYLPDHRWKVKYITRVNKDRTDENLNSEHEEIFDFVMRVIVVGAGDSGVDIAVELSHFASEVYLCTRRGTLPWILPRLVGEKPVDQLLNRFSNYFLPNSCSVFTKLITQSLNSYPQSLRPTTPFYSSQPTFKLDIFERLSTGTIIVKKNILELMPDESKSIKFVDGSIVENIDVIIYATGYNIDFPFLDKEIVNGGPEIEKEFEGEYKENLTWLYKMMFPPNYRNIAFIGLIQPIGSIFPFIEMQTRYVTSLTKGLINPLPSPQDMSITIRNYHEKAKKRYYLSARNTIYVYHVDYLDELAQELGCYPHSLEILKKFGFNIWKLVMFGIASPIQYRLLGRQCWEGELVYLQLQYKNGPSKIIAMSNELLSSPYLNIIANYANIYLQSLQYYAI